MSKHSWQFRILNEEYNCTFCGSRSDFCETEQECPKSEAAERKARPVASGVLAYFPRAIKAIAEISVAGSKQHHPGRPLHWDKTKSSDHLDCIARHLIDHLSGVPVDTDNMPHLGKVAWRALAALELYLEAKESER